MVSLQQLELGNESRSPLHYRCQAHLDLFDASGLERLATQAAAGRQLQVISQTVVTSAAHSTGAIEVRLCEDDYPGWLAVSDIGLLEVAEHPYQAIAVSATEIQSRIPAILAFAQAAMEQPNFYYWGGTVGTNYDCSGLVQAAFASVGIWVPRDAYQQEAFTQGVTLSELWPGDLIFFGTPAKATHVGLYLGSDAYIHSSGKDQGRNGIGIDRVSGTGDTVSQTYYAQLRGAGRVVASYQPQALAMSGAE